MDEQAVEKSDWPREHLEHLGNCPVCASDRRSILFDDLHDLSYGVAPGRWQLWHCETCSAAYLDPRPSEASISRAYARYYTHDSTAASAIEQLITGNNIKTRLRTGHYNHKLGHRLPQGASFAAAIVAAMLPAQAREWEHFIRHLPPPSSPGARLLDVGCGAGVFLVLAKALGYAPTGLEPDPEAARTARSAGIDVQCGSFPGSNLPPGSYEQITLSHVFEHLHHPQAAIRELFALLRPGGRIWFTQPNLDSFGLERFGKYWRGLEAPRHLSLFGVQPFIRFLQNAGFTDVRLLPPQRCAVDYYKSSLSMQEGKIPDAQITPAGWNARWKKQANLADSTSSRSPKRGESLTIIGTKTADSPARSPIPPRASSPFVSPAR